jgi:5-methylcytosine-specific restriction endonuclease McrA
MTTTARTLKEWIGETPDAAVPPRVRLRVLDRFERKCAGCTRPIAPGDKWTCDHKKALINGGENRERNLQPLCDWCDPKKTAADIAEKSAVYTRGLSHAGIRKAPKGRPLPGTRASGIRKPFNGPPVYRNSGKPVGGKRA